MSAYHGATRHRELALLPLLLAAIFGGMLVTLTALVLQKHAAKPTVSEFGLVCYSTQQETRSPYRQASAKQEPAMICQGAQKQ